jgi:hypothetical protein
MLREQIVTYELEKGDLETVIERVSMAYGEEIKFIVATYNSTGRTSRQKLPDVAKKSPPLRPLKRKQQAKSTPLKRIASQELSVKPRASKRPKVESRSNHSTPSTPSSLRSDSPVLLTRATHTSNSGVASPLGSTPEAFQKLTLKDNQAEWEDESVRFKGSEPDNDTMIDIDEDLDWEPLAKLRKTLIEKRAKENHSTSHRIDRPVFPDRSFWGS